MKLVHASLLNLLGLGVPMLVALALIPDLLAALGAQRFGLLALIWALANYFGLFDLGLSRVLTQRVAGLLIEGRSDEAAKQSTTALVTLAGLGFLAAVVLHLLAPALVRGIADVPSPDEAVEALRWMAWALPFFLVTAGLRGLLEAKEAFGVLNLIRLPTGVWTCFGPWWAVGHWGPDLVAITQVLVAGRLLSWLAHGLALAWMLPSLWRHWRFDRGVLRSMLVSGGWLTLGSLITPITAYADRFIIAAMLSTSAISHYVTPQELVTKLSIVPASVASALLPRVAARPDRELFVRALAGLIFVLLPVTLALACGARPVLSAWLGSAFDETSVRVLQILCAGVFINGLAYVPLTWLQAAGEFRAPVLVQCGALAFFVILLLLLCPRFGLVGAAWAWTLRMGADAVAMFWLCRRASLR